MQGPRLRAALASLDSFSAEDILLQPCHVFRSPPPFCIPQLRAVHFTSRSVPFAMPQVLTPPPSCLHQLKLRESSSLTSSLGSLRSLLVAGNLCSVLR